MPLKLPFYNEGFTQSGYMLIDKQILIFGFLPKDTTEKARLDADERRDDFMEQLKFYVHPHCKDPSVISYSFHSEISTELAKHADELNPCASHIRYEFSSDVDFITIWLFLVKIPQGLLSHTIDCGQVDETIEDDEKIDETFKYNYMQTDNDLLDVSMENCGHIYKMLEMAKNYFINLEQEKQENTASWTSYFQSFYIFGGTQNQSVDNNKDSQIEATRIMQEAMERDAILRRNFN